MAMVQITPPPLSSQAMTDLLCTIMLLCQGKDVKGKPFWAYMCIKPSMAKAFKEARDKGPFNLEDFGTVLEMGEGAHVPGEVRDRMTRDYGMNHQFEEQLHAAIERVREKYAL